MDLLVATPFHPANHRSRGGPWPVMVLIALTSFFILALAPEVLAQSRASVDAEIRKLDREVQSYNQYHLDDPSYILVNVSNDGRHIRILAMQQRDFLSWSQQRYYYQAGRRDTAGFKAFLHRQMQFSNALKQQLAFKRELTRKKLADLRRQAARDRGIVDCGAKIAHSVRQNLWSELKKRSETAWSKRRPTTYPIYHGLRDQIINANYGHLHYEANVNIWKKRFACFDQCIMATGPRYQVDQADQARYKACLKSCQAIRYMKCP